MSLKKISYISLLALNVMSQSYASSKEDINYDYLKNGEGSLIRILKQDEITLNGDSTIVLIPQKIDDGPQNKNFFIEKNSKQVKKDKNGNFLAKVSSKDFDSIHTFAVANMAMIMVDQDVNYIFNRKRGNEHFKEAYEQWKKKNPISIFPHDDSHNDNAYFLPGNDNRGELHFFSYSVDKEKYSSHSFDVVAHEAGHGILHNLRPDYISQKRPQTEALHESFGDLITIFTILNHPELRHDLIIQTKGNLHNKSFLPILAEQFALIVSNSDSGLRNADNLLKINDLKLPDDWEAHSLSRIFTGTIYNILARTFDYRANKYRHSYTRDRLLESTSKLLRQLTLRSFIEVEPSDPTFATIGFRMNKIAKKEKQYRHFFRFIKSSFRERGITLKKQQDDLKKSEDQVINSRKDIEVNKGICGTIQCAREAYNQTKVDTFSYDSDLSSCDIYLSSYDSDSSDDYFYQGGSVPN